MATSYVEFKKSLIIVSATSKESCSADMSNDGSWDPEKL